jgi:diguanylate cyclase (GGDEF)-like protein/PAS domain S-box-containing protein
MSAPRAFPFSPAAGLALAFGLVMTAILFSGMRQVEQKHIAADFRQRSENQIQILQSGFDDALYTLQNLNRLFVASDSVSREEFHAFTQPLVAKYPYIRAFNFHRLVTDSDRATYEAQMRKQFPAFSINDMVDGHLAPANSRERYDVVEYLEPHQSNEWAFGLDAFYLPQLVETFNRAVDSGQAAASPLFQLAQDATDHRGFMFMIPVYRAGATLDDVQSRRKNVIGDTSAVFHLDQLMMKIIQSSSIVDTHDLNVHLYAAAYADESKLVFQSLPDNSDNAFGLFKDPLQQNSLTFFVAGRPWHVLITAKPEPFSIAHRASLIMLATGILVSVLGALWVHTLASRTRKVEQLVSQRTAELQVANRRMLDDIAARQQAEQALRLYGRAIESSANGIAIVKVAGTNLTYEYVNPAMARITGFSAAETLNQRFGFSTSNLPGEHAGRAELRAAMAEQREGHALLPGMHKDGSHYWVDAHVSPVPNETGEITHHVLVLHDVTRTRMYETELEFQANNDALTALANRSLARDRLKQAIAYSGHEGNPVWVVYIDLDRFKPINDTLGYQAGDKLLVTIARRLQTVVLESDTAARFSGDEFALILSERQGRPLTTEILRRVLDVVRQPLIIDGHEIVMTCSVGVAVYPHDGPDADTLIQHADLAMFRAKEEGNDRFRFFTPTMNEQAVHRLRLESDLRNAIEREEFILHYQPQIDAQTGALVGAEALVRWQHPELGILSPMEFIGIAEDTGLITPLGEWVLRTACRQAKAWQHQGIGQFRMAVNMSACQFSQSGMVSTVASIIEETGIDPQFLEIELTESVLMTNVDRAIGTLTELKQLGVSLTVDDFGTGYSSLAYLKRFPIDMLKIDRSFVRDVANNLNDEQIVVSIISLAHNLSLKVVGEGVETKEQIAFLQRHGCDVMQGYFFGVPMPAESFERMALKQAATVQA